MNHILSYSPTGEWLGLCATAPWWVHAGVAVVVIGGIYWMMAGFIEGLRRWGR
jgi:hypothetical protein